MAYLFLITGALLVLVAIRPALRLLSAAAGHDDSGAATDAPGPAGIAAATGAAFSPEGKRVPGGDRPQPAVGGSHLFPGRAGDTGDDRPPAGRLEDLRDEVAALSARVEDIAAALGMAPAVANGGPANGAVFRAYLDAALAGVAGMPATAGEGEAAAAPAAGTGADRTTAVASAGAPGRGQSPGTAVAAAGLSLPPGGNGAVAAAGISGAAPGNGSMPGPPGGIPAGVASVPAASSWQEQVRRAYAAGEDIAGLARRFGRGKGEIELILNLQRQKH